MFFGTARQEGALPGVRKIIYRPDTQSVPEAHPYLQDFGKAVSHGSAIFRMADELRKEKFVPDIVYGASGWGPTMFIRDIYPYAQNLGYFEWFYRERGSNMDFDPDLKPTRGTGPRTRLRNSPILIDLFSCDRGLSPTHWQRQQFPPEFRGKMTVIHDGIDTNYFLPVPGAKLVLPSVKLELSRQDELITYVARGWSRTGDFPSSWRLPPCSLRGGRRRMWWWSVVTASSMAPDFPKAGRLNK